MQQHVWNEFNIILPVADVVWVFGVEFKLPHIAAVPQSYLRLSLILNQ